MTSLTLPASSSLRLSSRPGWLVARFARPQAVLSWAIVRGGRTRATTIAWCQVRDDELGPGVDPRRFLLSRLRTADLSGAVGLMTSRAVDRFEDVSRSSGGVHARCIATVGLGNALRIGAPTVHSSFRKAGTINLLLSVSTPLSPAAHLEALSLAAEARTAAILDAYPPATGTGTDCIVVACPIERRGAAYAGKHTALGEAIGAAVHDAVHAGALRWRDEREEREEKARSCPS